MICFEAKGIGYLEPEGDRDEKYSLFERGYIHKDDLHYDSRK